VEDGKSNTASAAGAWSKIGANLLRLSLQITLCAKAGTNTKTKAAASS
jgi:hypothetical protein